MDSPILPFRSSRCAAILLLIAVATMLPATAFSITADRSLLGPCPCNMSGHVVSWSCIWEGKGPNYPYPLPNVEMFVYDCLGGKATATSEETGYFVFSCIKKPTAACEFCVGVENIDTTCFISAFDASLLLRYLVGLEKLEKCPIDNNGDTVYPQQIAADVNCQNGIQAFDASLILRYAVQDIDHFDCPEEWVYYPRPLCVDACHQDLMVYCVCIGDVSGPSSGPTLLAASPPATIKLGIPSHYGEYVELPLVVSGAKDVFAVQAEMLFNEHDFAFESIKTAELTAGYMAAHNVIGGRLLIALAGAESFSGDGEVAIITLRKLRPRIAGVLNKVSLDTAKLNESDPVIIKVQDSKAEIFKLSLGPISPNPAARGTSISFNISSATDLSLSIYNVAGELVRTLYCGHACAGRNYVTWDGNDTSGSAVSKGVYFCRIDAGLASATEKIVLIE